MRHTRGHTGHRRSHHTLEIPRLSKCAECGAEHLRHRVCMHCGMYRGRRVVDVGVLRVRTERRAERKRKERGVDPKAVKEKEGAGKDKR